MAEDWGGRNNGTGPAELALGADRIDSALADNHAIDTLIHQRPIILRTKLAVLATEIHARLVIRDTNLAQIADDLLAADNLLLPWAEAIYPWQAPLDPTLRNASLERQSRLQMEKRTQETECWRDVAQVMSEFLAVWEALQQSQVRAEFLRKQQAEDAA